MIFQIVTSHHNYSRFSKYLQRGWIGGRKMDNTDIQYATFRNNIPSLVFASTIFGDAESYIDLDIRLIEKNVGLVPRWQIHFNFTILRLISYNLDRYWSRKVEFFQLPDSQLTEKDRIDIPCPDADYCFRNFFAYIFYAPLYFSGPIVSFNNFISQN
ncbi:unnamed protein product [Pneumocystis jirovecii]|uniref:Uncharacterized protein n=1 Tax=Pneumocystis jirovecii TaxID=42068 RepID=L0P7U3_PNEJI|nr:unnamed protein product [Pneumocystis jirovecii]